MSKHVLIIGGTGMLKGLVHWFVQNDFNVSIVGRSFEKYRSILDEFRLLDNTISFISVDYYDTNKFRREIERTVQVKGPVHICVSWMRSDAIESFGMLKDYFVHAVEPVRLFEIKGSHASRSEFIPGVFGSLKWKRVVLGFLLKDQTARWLTNDEICEGILKAIKNDKDFHMVGVVEPWDKRPI